MTRDLLEVLATAVAFTIGWCSCSWSCSRRVDCPRYKGERLEKWKRNEEQKLHDRHPTPPGGEAA